MFTALVTGGAGYIGSHATLLMLEKGWEVIVIDDLSNSSVESLKRVEGLIGKQVRFFKGSVLDEALLNKIFSENEIDVVFHFAGLKSVSESIQNPVSYYHSNVSGTLSLLSLMAKYNVFRLIFSSSATVYGEPDVVPITEEAPAKSVNPYGESKLVIENILRDIAKFDNRWAFGILRYFNPVGAHSSGMIGEDPNGVPNNLVPYVAQVAAGRLAKLNVFGGDYDTPDGTGVRDYIHVMDLVEGHLEVWKIIKSTLGVSTFNLGTGRGYSVLDIVKCFEKISGKTIPYDIVSRRGGDIAVCYADPSYAERTLGWRASRGLEEMLLDTWRWQSKNPKGYK